MVASFPRYHHHHHRVPHRLHLQHVECNICGCIFPQIHGSDGKCLGSICVAALDSLYKLYSILDTSLVSDKD